MMKGKICPCCGANEFKEKNGRIFCAFCDTEMSSSTSEIALDEDVLRLLRKCEENPRNARRYANLILDIDPTNEDALKYL